VPGSARPAALAPWARQPVHDRSRQAEVERGADCFLVLDGAEGFGRRGSPENAQRPAGKRLLARAGRESARAGASGALRPATRCRKQSRPYHVPYCPAGRDRNAVIRAQPAGAWPGGRVGARRDARDARSGRSIIWDAPGRAGRRSGGAGARAARGARACLAPRAARPRARTPRPHAAGPGHQTCVRPRPPAGDGKHTRSRPAVRGAPRSARTVPRPPCSRRQRLSATPPALPAAGAAAEPAATPRRGAGDSWLRTRERPRLPRQQLQRQGRHGQAAPRRAAAGARRDAAAARAHPPPRERWWGGAALQRRPRARGTAGRVNATGAATAGRTPPPRHARC
jgi:hypothetical protein